MAMEVYLRKAGAQAQNSTQTVTNKKIKENSDNQQGVETRS